VGLAAILGLVIGARLRRLPLAVRVETNRGKIERLMAELGRAVRSPGRVYFTGGVCAVLLGWRETTLDVDLKADPEPSGFFEALPSLKDAMDINIELASPDDFIPALPGWRERSVFIAIHGPVSFFHYDFYSQALSKIERFHSRDQSDVAQMLSSELVQRDRLLEFFREIEPKLIRFPAIDPQALRQRVEAVAANSA
jgi:hypothetical protein